MIGAPPTLGKGWTRGDAAVLAALAAIGVAKLLLPFTGDQALFVTGGNELIAGATLYDEVWDVKQPAIYWFASGSAALFDRSEAGFHVLGLVWQLTFSVVLIRTLATRLERRWVASVAPLVVVGPYLLGAGAFHADQVESLVMFPIYLSLWWAASAEGDRRRWALAGVAAAAVALFKLVYLPIPVVAWVVIARARRTEFRGVLTAGAVVAVVGCVVTAWLAVTGVLGEVVRITFEVTPQATTIAPRPTDRLVEAAVASLRFFPLVGALAAVGLVWRPRLVDPIERAALAMAVVGVPLYLVQHWWAYLLVWFLVPVGLLAVFALDRHAERLRSPVGVAVASLLVVPSLAANVDLARAAATNDLGLTQEGRDAIHAELEPGYVDSRRIETVFVEPGPIHVIGNPLIHTETGRQPAIAVNGWSVEQYPESVWLDMIDQLDAADPPYLVIDDLFTTSFAAGTEGEVFGTWLENGTYREVDRVGAIAVFAPCCGR